MYYIPINREKTLIFVVLIWRIIVNRVSLTQTILPMIEGYGLLATAEGFFHADRILPFHVLIYVLEGVIYVTEDGVDYAAGPGELLFLKSDLRHYGQRRIPRGTRWCYVHFALTQHTDALHLWLPKRLCGLGGSSLEGEITAFVEACRSQDDNQRWYLPQQLYVLLSHIAQWGQPAMAEPDLPERIARYLGKHLHQPFSAAELEKAFFLSYKHLAAVFKKSRGQTMQAYHQHLRMEAGARMLRETLLPVSEISEKLGFADALYFSRCFHAHAGMSPTAYRRQVRDY